jgi:hypothetical protein
MTNLKRAEYFDSCGCLHDTDDRLKLAVLGNRFEKLELTEHAAVGFDGFLLTDRLATISQIHKEFIIGQGILVRTLTAQPCTNSVAQTGERAARLSKRGSFGIDRKSTNTTHVSSHAPFKRQAQELTT